MAKKRGLFSSMFRKKEDDCCSKKAEEDCGCSGSNSSVSSEEKASFTSATDGTTVVTVVGPGCSNCDKLTKNATQAANELGIDYQLKKISDVMEIAATGVMMTPGLIINDKIVSTGKVPSVEEIKTLFASIE